MNGERLAETPNIGGAYPRLSARHVRLLSQHGETRSVQPGQVLVSEGQRERDFLVVLSGKVAVFEAYGTPQARMVRVHGRHRFLDELGLLTGQPSLQPVQRGAGPDRRSAPVGHRRGDVRPGCRRRRTGRPRRRLRRVGRAVDDRARCGGHILAVGDVRSGSIKRVASAVGEGAMAVHMLHQHLARFGRSAGQQT